MNIYYTNEYLKKAEGNSPLLLIPSYMNVLTSTFSLRWYIYSKDETVHYALPLKEK